MHGFSSGSSLLVNAEVDSMGGIVDSGVGIGTKTSPRQSAIVKAQVDLSLEYDVREERRRELEFLEKGGNPLDFKFGVVTPVSVQSSSLADQVNDQLRTCEVKGSFAFAASPHGDSIGSSGRQGATGVCEPNSADNFDGENVLNENEGKPTYAIRSNITPSEHSSQLGGIQNVRESEDSPIFHPKKAYRRRNRSKTNRDSARSSSTGIGFRGGHSSSLSDCHRAVSKVVLQEPPSDAGMDGSNAAPAGPTNGRSAEDKLVLPSSEHMHVDPHKHNTKDLGASTAAACAEPNPFIVREQMTSVVREFPTCSGAEKPEINGVLKQPREQDHLKGDEECSQTDGIVSSVAITLKGLESETSCSQTNVSVDRNGNTSRKNVDIEEQIDQKLPLLLAASINDEKVVRDREVADIAEGEYCTNASHFSQNHQASNFPEKDEGGTNKNQIAAQSEAQCIPSAKQILSNQLTSAVLVVKEGSLDGTIHKVEGCCSEKPQQLHNSSADELTKTNISCSVSVSELQLCDENQTTAFHIAHEERILDEAQNIRAKRKIMEELSLGTMPMEYRHKSHWDFVLEEMAWMANDFCQERVWKRTAATQLCYRAAFASRLRLEEQNKYQGDKVVAQTLAKAVADFWHSAALLVGEIGNNSVFDNSKHGTSTSENTDGNRNAKDGNGGHDEGYPVKNLKLAVQGYAIRFLQHNIMPIVKDAFPTTPERVTTIDISELTCQNQHPEETLFYVMPHRAMEAYRNYVERYLVHCERASNNMQEVNSSMYEAVAEFDYHEIEYEEEEEENLYCSPGAFEGRKESKFAQKKWKNPKLYSPRVYEVRGDLSYGPSVENRTSGPPSTTKRLANGPNACPIPTKRVRTASRQRVVGPFRSGPIGFMPVPSTDASSGDTDSFQDDQSTQCGGSFIPKGLEIQSGMDYNKQAAFDSAETGVKPKKKKKTKHQATAYEPRWQVDCSTPTEQKDHSRKRLEHLQFDSNGNIGPFGPHAKKPKLTKQSLDNLIENTSLMSGSVASPVGSQISNMSNPNKLIKLISGRDRGRKTKSLKMPSGQTGSVNSWSLFEDQALVVLVHDMGPNWELVSDAINSTLHFKCIFRKPKECKERHRILLEKSCGDGADIEDSGSSQPYPSALPGIPKGGARQLFQQLRGPLEEGTIKSHFEKIILIGQQLHGRKKEPKQLAPAHSSHLAALSQVIPNNLSGGVLTPLDLCDIAVSSPDTFSLDPHSGGLPLSNQGSVHSMPPSSTNSSLQGSASAHLNDSLRDARYGNPRTNLPIDEHQRIQQYNHMVSSRNIQQPNMSVPATFSTNHRGGHMLPGGNGMAMSGMNRSMSVARPGLQGVSSSSVLSSGSMAASNMVGMTSSMNMPSGATAGQGNPVLRPRDGLQMARPSKNSEHLRQMMPSEMQMQGSHLNNQGVPTFGGLSSTFPNQSASPSSPIYPVHQQQHQMPRQHSKVLSNSHHPHLQGSTHPGSTEQQAFAMRLARDRQLQQRILQRQQQQQQQQQNQKQLQQFPASGALISHAPTQSQLPISTSLPTSSQIKSQAACQPGSVTPSSPIIPVTSQQQQKHHGLDQMAQSGVRTMINEGGKQRQRQAQQSQQQLPQSGRHHPPQRQQSQSQQAKLLKGIGRGSISVLQNRPVDSSHLDGLSDSPGSQLEKEEQGMRLMPGQGYPTQSSTPVVPPHSTQSHPQQKLYPNLAPASVKQVQQIHSHPDSSNVSKAAAVTSASVVPSSNQGNPPSIMPSPNHQQLKLQPQPPSKLVNDGHPTIQRAVSQNFVAHSDRLAKPLNDDQRQAEQQMANNTHSTSTSSGIPPICVKSTNAIPVASSDGSAQWKTSEPPSDPVIPNSQLCSVGSPSMLNSSNNEPVGPGG